MPQFRAQIIELEDEQAATYIVTGSAEDAAYAQINQFLELTAGEETAGAVRVWAAEDEPHQARVFDWQAEISSLDDQPDDLEEDEIEMEAEITLEERMARFS
jgi:hypothetical protein